MSIAARLAKKPPDALLTAKRLMRGNVNAVVERTREEATEFARCLASPEARAAFENFLARSRSVKGRA